MPPGRNSRGEQIRYEPKPPWKPPPERPAAVPPSMDTQENALLVAKAALAYAKALRAELIAAGVLPSDEE